MEEVRDLSSQKNSDRLNAQGHLMVKNKRRDDKFYWCCERKQDLFCSGRAVTRLSTGQHVLINFVEHNHSPRASVLQAAGTESAGEVYIRRTCHARSYRHVPPLPLRKSHLACHQRTPFTV
ncbi:FLYWCH zinc finger domain protein [Trichuris suis]|nr:FLYWCH zinc finger domain protein [Trichuris suis]